MQNVVANDEAFSENGKNRWFAKDRPEKMRQLMIDRGCKNDEIATAHRVLTDAFPLCNDRNLSAHGDWWHFDTTADEIRQKRRGTTPLFSSRNTDGDCRAP